MHLLIHRYGDENSIKIWDNRGKSAKSAFKKAIINIKDKIPPFIGDSLIDGVIQEFDDIFRTPKVHMSGSARKWVLAEEISYSPMHLLFAFWNFTEFGIKLIDESFQQSSCNNLSASNYGALSIQPQEGLTVEDLSSKLEQISIASSNLAPASMPSIPNHICKLTEPPLSSIAKQQEELPKHFLNLAKNYYNRGAKGDLKKAILNINRALPLTENSTLKIKLYSCLSLIHKGLEDYEEAKKAILEAISLKVQDPFIYFQHWELIRGSKNSSEQEIKDAEQSLKSAIELDKSYELAIESQDYIGLMLELKHYTKLLKDFPDDAGLYFNRGLILYMLGGDLIDQAYNDFIKVIEKFPGATRAQLYVGMCCSRQGKHDEALGYYDKIITKNPLHATAFSFKAKTLIELNRLEEGLTCAEEALKIKPDLASAYEAAALIYSKQKKWDLAIQYSSTAIEKAPLDPNNYCNLGYYYVQRNQIGDLDSAIVNYYEALRLSPKDYDAEFTLVLALEKRGKLEDKDKIFEHLKHILQINPFLRDAQSKLKTILNERPNVDNSITYDRSYVYVEINSDEIQQFNYYNGLLDLGVGLMRKGDYNGAIKYFDEGLNGIKYYTNNAWIKLKDSFSQGKATAIYELCKAKHQQEESLSLEDRNKEIIKVKESISLYTNCANIDKMGIANSYNLLGLFYCDGNDRSNAKKSFQLALDNAPKHKGANYHMLQLINTP